MPREKVFSQDVDTGFGRLIKVEAGLDGIRPCVVVGNHTFTLDRMGRFIEILHRARGVAQIARDDKIRSTRNPISSAAVPAVQKWPSIVVVAEDPVFVRNVTRILEANSHELFVIRSADEAISACGAQQADACLILYLDLEESMPADMFCREWKELRPNDKVLAFMTHDNTVENAQRILNAGAVEVVVMPFADGVLSFNVSRLLEGMR